MPRASSVRLVSILTIIMAGMLPAVAGGRTGGPSTALAQSSADVTTIRRFDTSEPLIALTFDAGADRGYADQILDLLAAEGIYASFGMTGVWASQNPDLIERIVADGHHLINHSWNHPSFVGLTSAQRADQLERTEDVIRSLTGVELQPYFRPPYGEYNDGVLRDLAANGYTYNVLWTVDTLGWNGYSAGQINERVFNAAAPGAIILMHVGAQSRDAAAMPAMIRELRNRGYGFATVHDLVTGTQTDRFFPETGHWVNARFYSTWQSSGGLRLLGYPISDEFIEDGRAVQYFERARFERHPEHAGTRHEVLLGLLGSEVTASRRAAGEAPFLSINAGSDANCTFYPETGHRLCLGFLEYWEAYGGLPVFGYPISEEFRERNPDTGEIHTVQYFERARFEWHPEGPDPSYRILLGRLGAQIYETR